MARKRFSGRGRSVDHTGRSKGSDRFVQLHHWVLNAPAYRSLSVYGRAALIELYRLYNGSNNGKIAMSVRRLADLLNINKTTANKALKELQKYGFIRIAQEGSFNQKRPLSHEYVITEYGYNGQLATKDFMKWRPEDPPCRPN